MSDIKEIIRCYSVKYDRRIKKICSPLADHLNIPVFTYYFIEADGTFGYFTNALEFNDYYFSQNLYIQNPYFAHPRFFRSGHNLSPCTYNEEIQNTLRSRFQADHLFLSLEAYEERVEGFIFANTNVDAKGWLPYVTRLDLLSKFCRYFKREMQDLVGHMKADGFNIEKARGVDFHQVPSEIPLACREDRNTALFLKKIIPLSRQERRCLELFKQGRSAQATGAIMGLSQRTVESYFEHIKNKLGCSSKSDLLNF